MWPAQQGVFLTVAMAQLPFENQSVNVWPGLSDAIAKCSPMRFGKTITNPQVQCREITVGVPVAYEAGEAEAALFDDFEGQAHEVPLSVAKAH